MKKKTIYIITNSYPEKFESFNSQELEFATKNFDNIKILSFSKIKIKKNNVLYFNTFQGILELVFPKNKSKYLNYIKTLKLVFNWDPKEFLRNLHSYLIALAILRKIHFKTNDLLYSYWFSRPTIIAYYINSIINIDFVSQGHGSDVYIYPPKNLKKILKKSKVILTVSYANKKYLIKNYQISPEKIKIFKLGVPLEFYKKLKITKASNASTKRNSINFLTVARYTPVKGIDILLNAIYDLVYNKNIKNIHFNIFGGGKYYKNYLSFIKKHNLTEYVSLNRWIEKEQLIVELSKSDCFILPSRSEGLPVVLMEACAASLPIIATDVGGVSEIVIDNFNGILIKEISEKSISDAIESFLKLDKKEIDRMRKNSENLYLNNYILEKNLTKKYEFLENI